MVAENGYGPAINFVLRKGGSNGREIRQSGSCEQCGNYVYDEDYECYACEVDLDEDEMARFLADECKDCPYYQPGDEYLVVRKQM